MTTRYGTIFAAALAVAASGFVPATASGACDGTDAPWPMYVGPGLGGRNQPDTTITPSNAGSLATRWVADLEPLGGGTIQSTPIVVGGCVIVTTDAGVVAAFTTDGVAAWHYKVETTGPTGLGGAIVGSAAVAGDQVIVGVGQATTPFVVSLDLADGTPRWQTQVDDHPGNFVTASPVVAGDVLFIGIAGDEYGSTSRGGYAFLDFDGNVLAHEYTITQAEYDAGYRGASVWTSGSYADGFVYVGGGNPASKTKEHRYSNSLLKIDADPASPAFAEIVDAYKGNVDQYYPGIDRQPACEDLGEQQPEIPSYPWSLACVQFDIDFGASPSLWRDGDGALMLGGFQKSGVYHAVNADNMQLAWSTIVPGGPCFACNASSPATDGSLVFAVGSPGGALTAFTAEGGKYRWALPTLDGVHFQSVTVARGVVYATNANGLFSAVDAATGVPLSIKSFRVEAGSSASALSSSGVSVASDTVYAPNGSTLVAFSPSA